MYEKKDKVKEVLDQLVEMFKTGDVPAAIAVQMHPPYDKPSNRWSLSNKISLLVHGTVDARGYRQWQEVGRQVKKGARAVYILAPRVRKENDQGIKEPRIIGFIGVPVFKIEDTEGEELECTKLPPPDFPLLERAAEWGITVKAVNGNGMAAGWYAPLEKSILVATTEEKTFFHELSHAAHFRITKGKMKPGQDPDQEIIAELSAQTLCYLVGKRSSGDTRGNTYRYLEHYAKQMGKDVGSACLKVLSVVEKVLDLILNGDNQNENDVEDLCPNP